MNKRRPSDDAVARLLADVNAAPGGCISFDALANMLPDEADRLPYIVRIYRVDLRETRGIYSRQRSRVLYFLPEEEALRDAQRGLVGVARAADRQSSRSHKIDARKLLSEQDKRQLVNLTRASTAALTSVRNAVKEAELPKDVTGSPRLRVVNKSDG